MGRIVRLNKMLDDKTLKKELDLLDNTSLRLDEELLKKNLITENQRAKLLADFFHLHYDEIENIGFEEHVVREVTTGFVTKHLILPIGKIKNKYDQTEYTVAIGDPFDPDSITLTKAIFGENVNIIVSTPSRIQKIQAIVFTKAHVADAISEYSENDKDKEKDQEEEKIDADVLSAPAVKLAENIMREGIASGASDIHVEPYEENVRVRYRVDGVLQEGTTFEKKLFPALSTRFKILAGMNIAERRVPQDGRIKQKWDEIDYDFRVSTLPTVYGEKIVIRILDTTTFAFTRKKLGFLPKENDQIDVLLKKPHGIILLTGPTGCGKSTTLYSFIQEINDSHTNIITVEDPVEYTMEGVNQVQVNNKANLTFASALRSILRQDPNVIMIGEIRDEETAEIAIRSAITGHLVLSTLHTNDAVGAVNRLIDMKVQPYFVSDALAGVIAQRLVRRLCPNCKKKEYATKTEMSILHIRKPKYVYHACGCPACRGTGYKGRIGIHEVFVIDDEIRDMILDHVPTDQLKAKAQEKGMMTLVETCKEAVYRGDTSVDELAGIMYSKKDE
jgi:type IV pilus assembly protein PilB